MLGTLLTSSNICLLVCPFINSFIYSFILSFIHSSVHPFISWFINPSIYPLIYSFIQASIHPFIYFLNHSFIHSFITLFILFYYLSIHRSFHTFIHSLVNSYIYPLFHPSINLSIHLFNQSFIHLFNFSFVPFIHSLSISRAFRHLMQVDGITNHICKLTAVCDVTPLLKVLLPQLVTAVIKDCLPSDDASRQEHLVDCLYSIAKTLDMDRSMVELIARFVIILCDGLIECTWKDFC